MSSSPPFAALRHADFRKLWFGQLVSITGTQMRTVAVMYHLYQMTDSALALGAVGLARLLPMLLLGLPAGLVADSFDRRRVMMVTQTVMLLSSAGLAALTVSGVAQPWMIYALVAVAAAASTFDLPARGALIPELVPREHLANAMSFNQMAFQAASVLGPLLAGLAIGSWSVAVVYALDSLTFLAVLVALLLMHHRHAPRKKPHDENPWAASLEGLRFVMGNRLILSTMLLDFVAMFFGAATTMLPIFADRILKVDASGLGLLYAAPAMGAVAAAAVLSSIGTLERQGPILLWAVALYGVCTAGFGLSQDLWLSVALLAGGGGADAVSAVIRGTIRQMQTPDGLRGRMTAVNMLFFAGGPQLGEVEAGAAAHFFGPAASVFWGGAACLGAVGLVALKVPELRDYDR